MRKLSRKGMAILSASAVAAVAVNAGAAWAYWKVSGSGTATSSVGSIAALRASGTPAHNAPLFPGVTRGMRVTVTNPNSFLVRLSRIERSTAPVVVDKAHDDCVHSGVQLAAASYPVTWDVPANETRSFTLPDAITMTDASDSACQGATFRLPVLVTGTAV